MNNSTTLVSAKHNINSVPQTNTIPIHIQHKKSCSDSTSSSTENKKELTETKSPNPSKAVEKSRPSNPLFLFSVWAEDSGDDDKKAAECDETPMLNTEYSIKGGHKERPGIVESTSNTSLENVANQVKSDSVINCIDNRKLTNSQEKSKECDEGNKEQNERASKSTVILFSNFFPSQGNQSDEDDQISPEEKDPDETIPTDCSVNDNEYLEKDIVESETKYKEIGAPLVVEKLDALQSNKSPKASRPEDGTKDSQAGSSVKLKAVQQKMLKSPKNIKAITL